MILNFPNTNHITFPRTLLAGAVTYAALPFSAVLHAGFLI